MRVRWQILDREYETYSPPDWTLGGLAKAVIEATGNDVNDPWRIVHHNGDDLDPSYKVGDVFPELDFGALAGTLILEPKASFTVKAPSEIEHVAGPLSDDMQVCERCGKVIIDDRNMLEVLGNEPELSRSKNRSSGFTPGPVTEILSEHGYSNWMRGTSEKAVPCGLSFGPFKSLEKPDGSGYFLTQVGPIG